MKRRSFLSAIAGIAVSAVLCRAMECLKITRSKFDFAGWSIVDDPYARRFIYDEGKYIQVHRSSKNDLWENAPFQEKVLESPESTDERPILGSVIEPREEEDESAHRMPLYRKFSFVSST